MPTRLRRASFSANDKRNHQPESHKRRRTSGAAEQTSASSVPSPASVIAPLPALPSDEQLSSPPAADVPSEKTVDCLIAEDSESQTLADPTGKQRRCIVDAPVFVQILSRQRFSKPFWSVWVVCVS